MEHWELILLYSAYLFGSKYKMKKFYTHTHPNTHTNTHHTHTPTHTHTHTHTKLHVVYIVHSPTNALFINSVKSFKFTLKYTIISFLHVLT